MTKSKFAPDSTSKHVLSIWWALLWRGVAYGIPAGFVLGAIIGIVIATLERPDLLNVVGAMLGTIIYVPISLMVTTVVLKKRYRSFSISLSPHESAS